MTTENSNNNEATNNLFATEEARVIHDLGNSGEGVVNLVRKCYSTLHGLIEVQAKNHAELQELAQGKATQANVNDMKRKLSAVGHLLIDANSAVEEATVAVNNDSADAEPLALKAAGLTKDAVVSTGDCSKALTGLTERVKEVERRLDEEIDPAVKGMQKLWKEHEPRFKRLVREQDEADAAKAASAASEEAHPETKAMTSVNQVVVGTVVDGRRHYDPRGWTLLEWIVGLIVGILFWNTLGSWAAHVSAPTMHDWAWIWYPLFGFCGLTLGGFITSVIHERTSNRSAQATVEHTR